MDIIIHFLAGFGFFCLCVIGGVLALMVKICLEMDKEDKQRRQEQAKIKAMKEAEDIIYQLL